MATVTMNTAAKNYKTVLGHDPKNYDLAIVSIDSRGTPGALNEYVLAEYGYNRDELKKLKLNDGYDLLENQDKKSILFIVTIRTGFTGINLKNNLTNGLSAYNRIFKSKSIWIPLMGTGSGQLEFVDSYDTTVGVIKQFSDLFFSISIPNDNRGRNFIKQFHIVIDDNESENSSAKEPKSQTSFFLAGHIWGENDDQMNRFLANGIWENGHKEKDGEIVNSARLGDVIFLKSTFAKNSISYLRIKAVGQIEKNKLNGRELAVKWDQLKNFIDIEGLGKYRRTFSRVDANDIELIKTKVAQNSPRNSKGIFFPSLSPPFTPIRLKEYQIDDDGNFFYGQEVGEEIKDYDVIILPKSSYGGVGNHSISTHILKLLGIEKNSLKFSEENLIDHKYATHVVDDEMMKKKYILIFVVTRDKSKHHIQFDKQLVSAIENFRKSEVTFSLTQERKHLKIFIPFLGTGQAGMSIDESFKYLLPGIRRLRGLDTPKSIRINYPRDLNKESLTSFNNLFLNEFDLEPYQNGNDILDEDLELEIDENGQDKIPFHLDNVETVDRLNREPLARSLARLINNEIFANKSLQYSFMIHLQGEWGAGKSTFLNLIKKHLESDRKKWVVVNFDSWQNQRISPPWWSFIDQVYRQAIERVDGFTEKPGLWLKEGARRIIWYSGWNKIMALIISIILFLLLISYGGAMIKVVAELPSADNIDNSTKGLTLEVFAKLIVSLGSIVGLVYSLSKFLSTPFLMKSSGEAKSFMLRASDPMNRIKKHYNKLIENINCEGYNVAVFIDDIDRCDRSYTISLLEGIQTLFREKKVLYVVAGDKNWISTCFENTYKEFANEVNKANEKLGDLFLEKVFQLSIRMPNASEKTKEKYWNHILGLDVTHLEKSSKPQITKEIREELKEKVKSSYSTQEKTNSDILDELETVYQLSEEEVSDIAIEALDENTDDIRHLFSGHYSLINPNPRSVKRLANNYTMYRNIMIAERKDFSPNKLFRWLIIDDLYPTLTKRVVKLEQIDDVTQEIEKMTLTGEAVLRLNKLIFDVENEHGGKLEIDDIKDILGL